MADTNENMVMDISIPEAKTMQTHLASANPHPQYLIKTSLGAAASAQVRLGDLNDVQIVGDQLTGKVLALSGAIWKPTDVNTLVSQVVIPIADTVIYGRVRYATDEDVAAGATAAISPATMKQYVSNYIATTKAGPETQGTVRLASTDSEIASAITTGTFPGLVEQVNVNRYVNVYTVANDDIRNYQTYPDTVSNVSTVDNDRTGSAVYNVYSGGSLQSHINTTRRDGYITVMSGGNTYDTSTCGTFGIYQHGTARRTVMLPPLYIGTSNYFINDDTDTTYSSPTKTLEEMASSAHIAAATHCTWLEIRGTAHNLVCSASNWIAIHNVSGVVGDVVSGVDPEVYPKCVATVISKGHLAYATVEGTGEIMCGDGIVEHVVVRNTQVDEYQHDHYGLVIGNSGIGYHVTLTGDYARASIQGYAEDVKVYQGCHLDVAYATAKIRNLIVYNGGYVTLTSGATVEGLVLYPGAIVQKQDDCVVTEVAHCHEPDKTIVPVNAVKTVISSVVSDGVVIPTETQAYQMVSGEEYSANLAYSEALLLTSTDYTISKYNETTHTWGVTNYTEVKPVINLFSVDTPRLLRRTDTEQLESAAATTDWLVYSQCMEQAYRCYDAKVVRCTNIDDLNPKHFIISSPEGMYEDIHNSTTIKWEVIF